MITEPVQADIFLRTGQADLILFLARELLRDPYGRCTAAENCATSDAPCRAVPARPTQHAAAQIPETQ